MSDRSLSYETVARRINDSALAGGRAYAMLAELTGDVGARLSGSPEAARAVEWGRRTMLAQGLENVRLERVMVPHWVRGKVERASIVNPPVGSAPALHICALGGSVSTPAGGITGEVVEVRSLEEAQDLGEKGRGKIIFFNRPMDRTLRSTFDAYGGAVNQRVAGPSIAAKVGAIAVLVRSMTTAIDTFPHTGMLRYVEGAPRIPAVALSTVDAERLSAMLRNGKSVQVSLELSCATLPDAESANVIGEIRGTEKPEEVIVIGGHLDSWDLGQGAHDDGAGCVQAIEALRLLKSLGIKPKRTIRVVLFMNEENGLRGATSYADGVRSSRERHIAAIESDRGGFAPRGFEVDGSAAQVARLAAWAPLFADIGADAFTEGSGGADIAPLKEFGTLTIGYLPESHRYFDYHHSANDTFDKVNERELELGAAGMALLAYLLAEEGIGER
jgi:carboxypeptidase Q